MKSGTKKSGLKNTFLTGALLTSIFLGREMLKADEIHFKPSLQKLEEKVSAPIFNLTFDYNTGNIEKKIDYSESWVYFDTNSNLLKSGTNPELTLTESTQVQDIMVSIKDKDFHSYKDLGKDFSSLSEDQKIILLAAIDGLLYSHYTLPDYKCTHIASDLEQLANDMGIRTAEVSGTMGMGHAYNISKIDSGTAIIDGGGILITDTKNIEKTLEAYQKLVNSIAFQHLFFEDSKFKYRLITKDGKNFLDFIGYDVSEEPLKNSLIDKSDHKKSPIELRIQKKDYLDSFEFNPDCIGFFMKMGEIRGNSNSALDKMKIFQAGFKKDFLIPGFEISPSINIIDIDKGKIQGLTGDLLMKIFNKNFNLSFRSAGNMTVNMSAYMPYSLFYDSLIGSGISYKIPLKNFNVEPYLISQFSILTKDLKQSIYEWGFKDLTAGTVFDIPLSDNFKFSIDPYYTKRIWEQEFGAKASFGNKNLKLKLGEYFTKSNYDFCPDKMGHSAGIYFSLGNFDTQIDFKNEIQNYDGEIDNEYSLSLKGNIKF